MPVEAETRIWDTQALRRRIALKARDGNAQLVLLVLADTRHNRRVLRVAADDFRDAFPCPPAEIWAALLAGTAPTGSGILLV